MLLRMLCAVLTVSSSLPAESLNIAIDHVTIAGPRIEVLRNSFTAVSGIPTEYGGRHSNHATEMAITSFSDGSYLEFMAIQDSADPKALADHVWSKFLNGNAGPCAFAIRVPNVSSEAALLNSRGVTVKQPVQSGRMRPDGFRLEWRTSDIGNEGRGTFFPFLIEDVTPRDKRAYPSGKPTATNPTGIAMLVIAVNSLDTAITEYRRAFNLPAPLREHDTKSTADLAWFEGTPVVLAKAYIDSSWLALRVRRFGVGPCAVVLHSGHGLVGGGAVSKWFGRTIFWSDDRKLGWHLGTAVD